MTSRRARRTFMVLVILCIVASALELSVGQMNISPTQLLPNLLHYIHGTRSPDAVVVGAIRIPRLLVALAVGANLAIVGAVLQAVFRNPMSDPGVIGVSSGSALGAVIVIHMGLADKMWTTPLGAFIFGMAVVLLIYRLSTLRRRTNLYALLLAGIAVGSFCSALITAFLTLSPLQTMQQMLFWLMGGLDGSNWEHVILLYIFLTIACVAFSWMAWALDIMMTGEEHAQGVGVPVQRLKQVSLGVSALIVGVCVSTTGVISFVGLIVPHMLRQFVGSRHRVLIPASALGGAALLALSDLAARMVFSPVELNIGIVTSCFGAPFFLYLLFLQGRKWQRS